MQNILIWNQPKPAASRCSSMDGTVPPGDGGASTIFRHAPSPAVPVFCHQVDDELCHNFLEMMSKMQCIALPRTKRHITKKISPRTFEGYLLERLSYSRYSRILQSKPIRFHQVQVQVQVVYSQLLANSDKTKLTDSEQAILVCVFLCRHCQYCFRSKKSKCTYGYI